MHKGFKKGGASQQERGDGLGLCVAAVPTQLGFETQSVDPMLSVPSAQVTLLSPSWHHLCHHCERPHSP